MILSNSPRTIAICFMAIAALSGNPLHAKECYAPDARSQSRAFSRAVITEGGKTIWLGGQTASDPKADFDTQVRSVFSSIDNTIKAAGGKGIADMVTMTAFINDNRLGNRFVEIRKEVFKDCFPASALITVSGFARPGLLLEVQGVAVIDGQ